MADQNSEGSGSQNSSASKFLPLLNIVNILACLGVIVVLGLEFLDLRKQDAEIIQAMKDAENAKLEAERNRDRFVPLKALYVRLKKKESEHRMRYLQMNISIRVDDLDTEELIKARLPLVRSTVLEVFSKKHYLELSQEEEVLATKEQAVKSLNNLLGVGGVKAIYLSSFSLD